MNDIVQASPTKDECNLAMLAHIFGIFTGFIGALVLWLIKKDESAFVGEQAREALNFQITMALAFFISWILMFVVIGIFLIPILVLVNFVLCILAAVSASKGKAYRYPFAIRLVK